MFGCFFFGLAIGGLLAAKLLSRTKNPWLAVAYSELAIAALAVPALTLSWWTDWIWPTLGPERLISWQGGVIKTLLSAAVVLLPAIPMGMTLPFFVAAATQHRIANSREGVWIYAVNTFGGVIGLIATSTVLLERLGVVSSMTATLAVNVFVALAAWFLSRVRMKDVGQPNAARQRKIRKKEQRNSSVPAFTLDMRDSLTLSFLSGLAMLSFELLAIRMISLVVPSSFQATASVLASVILVLAIAAIATPLLLRFYNSPRTWLLTAFIGAIVLVSIAPLLLYVGTNQLVDVSHLAANDGKHLETTRHFFVAVWKLTLMTAGPALLLCGMLFPIVLTTACNKQGTAQGKQYGYLLAANGVGGIIGAELADLVIVPIWGIYQGLAVVAMFYGIAMLFVLAPWRQPKKLSYVLACGSILAPLAWGGIALSRIPYLSPRTKVPYEVQATEFGRDGVLLVVDSPTRGKGILLNNQYMLGSSGSLQDERREVLLPLLIHPHPERICCVGLATGISAGAAIDYSATCHVTAIEISSLVTKAAKKYFGDFNNQIFENSQANIVVEDGRTYIAAVDNEFDVIVGDLYRPYGAGEGRLFSVEHIQAAKKALRDGGLFCQWLPMYQLTESHFRLIAASFLDVFPNAEIVRANDKSDYPLLGLVGWKDTQASSDHIPANCKALKEMNRIDDARLLDPEKIGQMRTGHLVRDYFKKEPLNTLDNALIEILAGRRRVTRNPRKRDDSDKKQEPYLVGTAWRDFVERLPLILQK